MKYYLILFSFLLNAICVQAAPWGAMRDYVEEATANKPGATYLIPKVVEGESIRVQIDISPDVRENENKVKRVISENYNKWFKNTLAFIFRYNRSEEFKDIIPTLERGVTVEFVDDNPDIYVDVVSPNEVKRHCGYRASGCYLRKTGEKPIPHIYIPSDSFIRKVATSGMLTMEVIGLHEIGHSLGLSDQYAIARDENSHHRYSSAEMRKGVMSVKKKITCDDADGIINLIDIYRSFHRNGEVGWKSLCPDSKEYYINGQSGLRGPYRITTEDGVLWTLAFFADGNKMSSTEFRVNPQNAYSISDYFISETPIKRDGLNRVVFSQGGNGEKIYYSYLYEQQIRMVTKDGQLLIVDAKVPKWNNSLLKRKVIIKQFLTFGTGDSIANLSMENKRKGAKIEYQEINSKNKITEDLTLEFDEKGNIMENNPLGSTAAASFSAGDMYGALGGRVSQSLHEQKNQKLRDQIRNWYLKTRKLQ